MPLFIFRKDDAVVRLSLELDRASAMACVNDAGLQNYYLDRRLGQAVLLS